MVSTGRASRGALLRLGGWLFMNEPIRFYLGGYAKKGENGLLRCAFADGRFSVECANNELENPSWLLPHPAKPLIYAVEELSPQGRLAVLEDRGGSIVRLASVSTEGADPCHIAADPDFRHLFVSNYSGGSLAVYALDEAGLPARMTDFRQHHLPAVPQAGGNPARQEGPHVHFSLCDGEQVYVNDLGRNQVIVYDWDGKNGCLTGIRDVIGFPAGAGPRHLTFDAEGRHLYVICELDLMIHVFLRQEDGTWRREQVVSAVPGERLSESLAARSTAAAIHFADEHTLCASTRGFDLLAVFRVDDYGLLTDRQIFASGGRMPRDFLPAGDMLFAANQGSGCVQAFRRAGASFAPVGAPLPACSPTCLCALPRFREP